MAKTNPTDFKRPSLFAMALQAMGMISSFGLAIGAGIVGYFNPRFSYGSQFLLIWISCIVFLFLGVWFFRRLKQTNDQFINLSRQSILNSPENILMQWTINGHDYLIARQGLIVDQMYHGFNEAYEYLDDVRWESEDSLRLVIAVYGGKRSIKKNIDLPIPEHLKQNATGLIETLTWNKHDKI